MAEPSSRPFDSSRFTFLESASLKRTSTIVGDKLVLVAFNNPLKYTFEKALNDINNWKKFKHKQLEDAEKDRLQQLYFNH